MRLGSPCGPGCSSFCLSLAFNLLGDGLQHGARPEATAELMDHA